MFSDWVLFLAYPNLFGIKGFVVVVFEELPNYEEYRDITFICSNFQQQVTALSLN
jgi:hypothetical protein